VSLNGMSVNQLIFLLRAAVMLRLLLTMVSRFDQTRLDDLPQNKLGLASDFCTRRSLPLPSGLADMGSLPVLSREATSVL